MTQLTFKCLTSPIDRSEKWRTWVMIVLSWILSWLSASLAVFIRSRSACSPVTSLWPRLTSASSSACTTAAFDSRSSVNHRYKHYPLSVSTDWLSCGFTSHSTKKQVISETFPLGLAWKKLNLTQQQHVLQHPAWKRSGSILKGKDE